MIADVLLAPVRQAGRGDDLQPGLERDSNPEFLHFNRSTPRPPVVVYRDCVFFSHLLLLRQNFGLCLTPSIMAHLVLVFF